MSAAPQLSPNLDDALRAIDYLTQRPRVSCEAAHLEAIRQFLSQLDHERAGELGADVTAQMLFAGFRVLDLAGTLLVIRTSQLAVHFAECLKLKGEHDGS